MEFKPHVWIFRYLFVGKFCNSKLVYPYIAMAYSLTILLKLILENMRFISTKTHGMLDYTSGILLILAPWIFNFDTGRAEQWIPIVIGLLVIGMSLFTDYELGVVKKISMASHLSMDIVIGIFLALSPWLFGFSEVVYWPHLLLGILSVGAGLFTHRSPVYHVRTAH